MMPKQPNTKRIGSAVIIEGHLALTLSQEDREISCHYRVLQLGSGANEEAPLVFLHDALGSISSWRDWPERLCRQLQRSGLVIERMGHGDNVVNQHPKAATISDYFEFEAYEYLPALLDHLDIKRCDLIGFSDGATIALMFASRFPSRVMRLVAMAGHIMIEGETVAGVASAVGRRSELSAKVSKFHRHPDALIERWSSYWCFDNEKWDISNLLGLIQAQTLLIQGEADQFATTEQLLKMADQIPRAQVYRPRCDHFLIARAADELLHEINRFYDLPTLSQ